MYYEEMERRLRCGKKLDALERRFDEFLDLRTRGSAGSQRERLVGRAVRDVLSRAKAFLSRETVFRNRLFRRHILRGSDCLTLTTLAVLLAKRKGVEARVAVPRKLSRILHAVAVFQEDGGQKSFVVSGRTRYDRARPISPLEVELRLKLTKPFINAIDAVVEEFS